LVTSRQSDAPSARLTNAQPQCLSTKARRTRPAARASLPRPIHSVKQQTANQAARLAKALNGAPKKSPHLNEGTRLIRPSRSSRQRASETRFTAAWRTCRGAGGDRQRTLDMGRRDPS
jgi:hypothetical protein